MWNHKRLQIARGNMRKKSKAGDVTLPGFKLYYKAIIIKQYVTGRKTDQ